MRHPVLPFDTLRDRLPKGLALLIVLAVAPLLGGCTLTLGTTGAIIDHVAAQKPTARYTLDDPPPLDAPVEVVLRSGGEAVGGWRGNQEALLTTATSMTPATVRSMIVLHGARGQRIEVPADQVVQIRARPVRRKTALSMMLIGLVIDGVFVKLIYEATQCTGQCRLSDEL